MILSKSSLLKKGYFRLYARDVFKSFFVILKSFLFMNKKETLFVHEGRAVVSCFESTDLSDPKKSKELLVACPTGAIFLNSESKSVEFDATKCTACCECKL